jgi:hypothetical protein
MSVTVTPGNVRSYIDTMIDAGGLPDAIINLPGNAGAAIIEVKRRVPNADTLQGDDLAHLNNAADYLTAATVLPSVSTLLVIIRNSGKGGLDIEEMQNNLRNRADDEIAIVLAGGNAGAVVRGRMPKFFAAADAKGRW